MGGSRFIGFHLLWTLYKQGHDITVFNRMLSTPPKRFPKGIKFIRGDRNCPEDLKRLFDKEFDVVFDISGYTQGHVAPIVQHYNSCIRHYIFLSSAGVYQKPSPNPFNEMSPRIFAENESGGKALIEDMLLKQYHENNFPVTIFQPQGVIGPYDACLAGLIFYRLIHSLPLFIFPGVDNRVNYLFVHDLVRAFCLAMNNPNTYGSAYVVAGDDITTLHTFIELCGKVSAMTPILNYVDNPAIYENVNYGRKKRHVSIGLVWSRYDQVCDNSKIKKELGINFTGIEIALKETWDWLIEKPAHLNYFALRGERYILRNRPIPVLVKAYWMLTDACECLRRLLKDTIKRILWLRNSYLYLKRLRFI